MDFEAIIDRECPTPIHWLTHRRYVIGRVKYEVENRDDRIAALESTERELREAVKVLAADLLNGWNHADTGKDWPDSTTIEVHNNQIAAAAVREAGR